MRIAVLLIALAITAPWATAQRAGFGGGHFGNHPSRGFGMGRTGARPSPFYDPYAFWGGPLYSSDFYDAGYPVASQPPAVVMQPPAASPSTERAPADPLMIELQGDHYVQSGAADDRSAGSLISIPPETTSFAKTQHEDLKPVILIFRDGHQEEVRDYTIADGVLYARANFYADGAWNKKIELARVNVADTIATNQSRGVAFRLPASPNEVITRP